MSRSRVVLAIVTALLALAVSLFYIKVGGVIAGAEQIDCQVGYCFDVATGRAGGRLYVAAGQEGLHILDARDPYAPSLLGKVSFAGMVEGVHIADGVVYVTNAWLGVRSIDIGDPQRPVLIDTWSTR